MISCWLIYLPLTVSLYLVQHCIHSNIWVSNKVVDVPPFGMHFFVDEAVDNNVFAVGSLFADSLLANPLQENLAIHVPVFVGRSNNTRVHNFGCKPLAGEPFNWVQMINCFLILCFLGKNLILLRLDQIF